MTTKAEQTKRVTFSAPATDAASTMHVDIFIDGEPLQCSIMRPAGAAHWSTAEEAPLGLMAGLRWASLEMAMVHVADYLGDGLLALFLGQPVPEALQWPETIIEATVEAGRHAGVNFTPPGVAS